MNPSDVTDPSARRVPGPRRGPTALPRGAVRRVVVRRVAAVLIAAGTVLAAGAAAATSAANVAGAAASAAALPRAVPGGTLGAFRSDAELAGTIARWAERARAAQGERRRSAAEAGPPPVAMQAAPAAAGAKAAAGTDGITNVQVAGVDEGGIVKLAGEHLVVLRRGRLFTVRVGGDTLRPVAAVDASGPDVDPRGTWYDELLVSGRDVIVIGYSYARGGTEIGLFALDADGGLRHRATWQLRSADYFSSRNYASRLVGRQLVLYAPVPLSPWAAPDAQPWPALRRWDASAPAFRPILPATRVYRTDDEPDPAQPLALHAVIRCGLGDGTLDCTSSAVLGPLGRTFFVSRDAVHVWTSSRPDPRTREAGSALFRLPLDGAAPSALKTVGVPIDAQSFAEDEAGTVSVLLRAHGAGEAMGGGERRGGELALLRVRAGDFGDGRTAADASAYRRLPSVAGAVRNRWVGPWLLWGGDARAPRAGSTGPAWALRADDPVATPVPLAAGHAVERIEALGPHGLLVGRDAEGLRFTGVSLGARDARLAGGFAAAGLRQSETRSHGFFFRADDRDGSGLLGLPVAGGEPIASLRGDPAPRAGVLFLRSRALELAPLGALEARAAVRDDGCRASCVDWYGNARPIFVGARVFALMGYELVEGRIELDPSGEGEAVVERRRVDFAPRPGPRPDGRGTPFG